MTGRRRPSGHRHEQGIFRGSLLDAEMLARRFHETYERVAPAFGYSTRPETAVPWEQVPEQNRRLMIAVCQQLISKFCGGRGAPDTPDARETGASEQ
jgi:hypothetical protein